MRFYIEGYYIQGWLEVHVKEYAIYDFEHILEAEDLFHKFTIKSLSVLK